MLRMKAEVEKILADSPLTNEPLLIRPLEHAVLARENMASITSVQAFLGHVTEEEQLNAVIVKDGTVPSGQAFPPGAEFIKTWRVMNSGSTEWPKSTELVFTGGDAMTTDTRPILVGNVKVGAEVELSTPGLKVGFWFASRTLLTMCGTLGARVNWQLYRLLEASDGRTRSIWRQPVDRVSACTDSACIVALTPSVSIIVTEPQGETESLSSSSIMKMPGSVLHEGNQTMSDERTSRVATDETMSNMGSLGSAEILDNLSYDSDWQDCPGEQAGQEEYVILYDDSSSEEN